MGLFLGSIACVVVLYLGALVLTKKQTPEKDRPGQDNIAAVIIVGLAIVIAVLVQVMFE